VVVGAVDTGGILASYSQGSAAELTVAAAGRVFCASHEGGDTEFQGTSYGEPLSMQISTSDDIGHLAAPAVAGLAAYLMSLDQYRVQLLVPGSVARNVRDLIKSLAYARLPLQPAVVWNGIDSQQIYCPVRRDTRSPGCPAQNTTSPIGPPVHSTPGSLPTHPTIPGQPPKVTTTSSSNPPPPSNAAGSLTITVHSSFVMDPLPTTSAAGSSNALPSSIATDSSSTTDGESFTSALTISPSRSTATVES